VPAPSDPSAIVTLTRCGELTTAQLLRGRLDAEGIECFIPDEHLAAQTWHLTRAIGGIRVQVRQADMERAQQVLALPGTCEDAPGATAVGQHKPNGVNGTDTDDGSISVGDRAGYRALRVALVSLWLMGLIHPYSLLLAVRALGRPDLTAWGRRRAAVALLVSLAGCAWMAFLVYRFWKLSR
jgi:L-2-hydroxyglutarate oxidase LhgO